MIDLQELKLRYLNSPYKNNDKLSKLDNIDFLAVLYNLQKDIFDINGFSNKSFLRYIGIADDLPTQLINEFYNKVDNIKSYFLAW